MEAGGQQCENLLLNKVKRNAQEKCGLYTAGNFKLYMSKCYHNNCHVHEHSKKYSLDIYPECLTRYRTRHFFNNFTTIEDIGTKCEADLPNCVRNVTTS
jgi:hypothetical protein